MTFSSRSGWAAVVAALALAAPVAAQQPAAPATPAAPAAPTPGAIAIGQPAPDFSLSGSTRYGQLRAPVRLRDYRGQTVVLAFFFKARTKG